MCDHGHGTELDDVHMCDCGHNGQGLMAGIILALLPYSLGEDLSIRPGVHQYSCSCQPICSGDLLSLPSKAEIIHKSPYSLSIYLDFRASKLLKLVEQVLYVLSHHPSIAFDHFEGDSNGGYENSVYNSWINNYFTKNLKVKAEVEFCELNENENIT